MEHTASNIVPVTMLKFTVICVVLMTTQPMLTAASSGCSFESLTTHMGAFEERISSQMKENIKECHATLARVNQMIDDRYNTNSGVYVANATDYKNINYTFNVFRDGSENHGFGGNWTVFQRRFDGSVDFNRSWAEYRDGFGDVRGEHWLGLEKVKFLLDSGRHELLIVLEDFEGVIAYAKYDNFMLGSEAESYKIKSLGNYRGNAGDALKIHNNRTFATYDKNDDRNCAKTFSSGGWYESCCSMNLNGPYMKTELNVYVKGVIWSTFRGIDYSLKSSKMMIRPV